MTRQDDTSDDDGIFMSASDLRAYMTRVEMERAEKEINQMDAARRAHEEIVARLSQTVEPTPERIEQGKARVMQRVRRAAADGLTEIMVMRFLSELCSDGGRAINNNEPDWDGTLTGMPGQAFRFWEIYLKPAGYRLAASIITWPDGVPGDVGLFLRWGDEHPV